MNEFQQGKIRQDTPWRSDSWMAGMLLCGAGSQDPGPIMNLKGFGGLPISSLAAAWHHCSPKDPWGARGTNLRVAQSIGAGHVQFIAPGFPWKVCPSQKMLSLCFMTDVADFKWGELLCP